MRRFADLDIGPARDGRVGVFQIHRIKQASAMINRTERYPSTQSVGVDKKERKKEREKERKKIPGFPDYLVEPKNDLRWKFQQKKI